MQVLKSEHERVYSNFDILMAGLEEIVKLAAKQNNFAIGQIVEKTINSLDVRKI